MRTRADPMRAVQYATAALFVVSLALAPAARAGDAPIDMSGTWKINRELSDDPQKVMEEQMKKMREEMGGRRVRGGLGRGGGFRGGGSRGTGGGGAGGMDREQARERLRDMDRMREQVRIVQSGEEVAMIFSERDTISVIADAVRRTHDTPAGEVAVTAYWEGVRLVVTRELPDRPQTRQYYEINDDGNLQITFEVTPPNGEAFHIRSIYEEVTVDSGGE
jgi:hypothetical protein